PIGIILILRFGINRLQLAWPEKHGCLCHAYQFSLICQSVGAAGPLAKTTDVYPPHAPIHSSHIFLVRGDSNFRSTEVYTFRVQRRHNSSTVSYYEMGHKSKRKRFTWCTGFTRKN